MQYYDLRRYQLRNGYTKRMAAAKPAGANLFGAFNSVIGEGAPALVTLQAYATFAQAEQSPELDFDYVGYERTLLRSFPGVPDLQPPAKSQAGHIFEMRTYQSNSAATLQKKIDMFTRSEITIFRSVGITPLFFGEALTGARLPHLTYMLCYDDLAARDRLWKAFGADPAWQKLRATPGLTDADLVSNITNTILRATDFSDIR